MEFCYEERASFPDTEFVDDPVTHVRMHRPPGGPAHIAVLTIPGGMDGLPPLADIIDEAEAREAEKAMNDLLDGKGQGGTL